MEIPELSLQDWNPCEQSNSGPSGARESMILTLASPGDFFHQLRPRICFLKTTFASLPCRIPHCTSPFVNVCALSFKPPQFCCWGRHYFGKCAWCSPSFVANALWLDTHQEANPVLGNSFICLGFSFTKDLNVLLLALDSYTQFQLGSRGGEWCLRFLRTQLNCNTVYPGTTSNLTWRAQSDKIAPPPTSISEASCKFRLSSVLLTNLIQIRGPHEPSLCLINFLQWLTGLRETVYFLDHWFTVKRYNLGTARGKKYIGPGVGNRLGTSMLPGHTTTAGISTSLPNLKLSKHVAFGFWWRLIT